MYHYLQFRVDKKEKWHLVDEKQLASLEKPPAFLSVLKVDQDVDFVEEAGDDPLDVVKYKGPMYFDLDNADDITSVLENSRKLLDRIVHKFGIDPKYIQCWLSGGKGVHLIIPEQLFGVKRPIKYLPVIYHELAKQVEVEDLDMGVYSAGKGRLWRCANIARPGKGTYKVSVTVEELRNMDADDYETLTASARPDIEPELPPSNLSVARAETAFKAAKQAATRRIKAVQNAKTVPTEDLRNLSETPGCIQKLITEGDCPSSNWNQAAMQVAAWVAARYEKDEESEYLEEVVEPFVKNVDSSSRPTEKERRKHVRDQLNRAFSGRTKFAVGPLIKTIGEPCHECPLCRGDMSFEGPADADHEDEPYDPRTKIKASKNGYMLVSDNGAKELTTWTFWPDFAVRGLEETESGDFIEGPREAMVGTLVDDRGNKARDVKITEQAWQSRSTLMREVGGYVEGATYCGDVEAQKIFRSILSFASRTEEGLESMTETPVCGIYLERRGNSYLPHYIEHGASIMPTRGSGSVQSRFRYRGESNLSPSLIDEDFPYIDDTELEDTLHSLLRVNHKPSVAKIAGWFAACHLREHIHHGLLPQFPLLGIWGNASAGKTMTALLFAHLTGMDYQSKAEPINMETSKAYPLKRFVSSSTTVPRLVEEINQKGMKASVYSEVMGVFKAAWNRSTIQRGVPTKSAGVKLQVDRVSSPIVFVCEGRPDSPAVRNRTVEVQLTAQNREEGDRSEQFLKAYAGRRHLFRAAKAMLQRALTMSTDDVSELVEAQDDLVPKGMDERPRFSFKVLLAGLQFMADALKRCDIDITEDIEELKQAMAEDLDINSEVIDREKRRSEVDRILEAVNDMAGDSADKQFGIVHEDHYWKVGKWIKLDVRRIMPRYRRYCRSMGDIPQIKDAGQLGELMAGEVYFDRFETHPEKPNVQLHVLDEQKLAAKGIHLSSLESADADYV